MSEKKEEKKAATTTTTTTTAAASTTSTTTTDAEEKDEFGLDIDDEPAAGGSGTTTSKSSRLLLAERSDNFNAHADVTFLVGKDKKSISAHKIVLAIASPVFEAMLYPTTFDKDGNQVSTVEDKTVQLELPEEDPAIFSTMLTCIYTDKCEVVADTLKPLIAVATRYQIDKLHLICAEFLSADVTIDNACEMLQLTNALGSQNEQLDEFVSENSEEIFATDAALNLNLPTLKALVASDKLGLDEYPLFEWLTTKWGPAEAKRQGKDDKAVKDVLAEFVPLIRWPLLSIQELLGAPTKLGLLDQKSLLTCMSYIGITDEKIKKNFTMPFNTKAREGGGLVKGKDSKLIEKKHKKDLVKMFDNKKVKLSCIFRASRDGFDSTSFHAKCDGKGATLVVVKSNSYIFGGFNPESWNTGGNYVSSGCWLFQLDNPSKQVCKFQQSSTSGAYNYSSYGPTFGGGHDMYISSSFNSSSNYCSPSSFCSAASGWTGSLSSATFCGGYSFTITELEVFAVQGLTKK